MTPRTLSHRSRVAVLAAALVAVVVPFLGASAAAETTSRIVMGNPKCSGLGYSGADVKLESAQLQTGTAVYTSGTFSVTVTLVREGPAAPTGEMISFSSASVPVDALYAKGSDGGTLYEFSPATTSATGMQTITNNPADKPVHFAAFSHVNFCFRDRLPTTTSTSTTTAPTTTTTAPPLLPLEATVSASGSYTKTFLWTLDKEPDRAWSVRNGSTAPVGYTIDLAENGHQLSGALLGGTVSIANPNSVAVVATVSDSCGGETEVTVPPSGATEPISCDIGEAASEDDLPTSLVVTFTWDDPHPQPIAESAGAADASIDWDVAKVNETVTVVDVLDGGAARTLGSSSATTSFVDGAVLGTPAAEGCRTVSNTATILETGQADTAFVGVCRQAVTRGGFTIGYWGNKNGQARIAANAAALCSGLAAYPNVLGALPAACSETTLPSWVKAILGAATSKGDGSLMLKAQLLATALNVVTYSAGDPPLGAVDIPVSGGCTTVRNRLAWTNTNYSDIVASKAALTTVKDVFDRVNNNTMAVCGS